MTNVRPSSLASSCRIQLRVVAALLMREVITRYGRNNIGMLWLIIEPILFTFAAVLLFEFFHQSLQLKIEIVPFMTFGYSGLLLWRSCATRGIMAIEPNRNLMYHRQVKVQDIFIARMLLEIVSISASFFICIVVMMSIGLINAPKDILLILAGWLLLCWFSACLGTILGCLSEHSELVDRIWHPISYFMLPVSGTFFMVDWLPSSLHGLALLVPMVNCVEMLRGGYFGSNVQTHYDWQYVLYCCLSMSLVALMLMSDRKLKKLN
jgi:capsular polysaccharide transport system permease protein